MTRLLIDNRCATSAREECPAETSSGERKSVKNRRSHGEEVFFERETHCGSHRTEWVGIEPKIRIFWRRQFAVQITIIGQRAAHHLDRSETSPCRLSRIGQRTSRFQDRTRQDFQRPGDTVLRYATQSSRGGLTWIAM